MSKLNEETFSKVSKSHNVTKSSIATHVYMGICYWGVTKLMFVTGTQKQPSNFVDPKSKCLYVGVGGLEYHEVLSRLFFFLFFFFGRERYSLHKCNDSNLKSM